MTFKKLSSFSYFAVPYDFWFEEDLNNIGEYSSFYNYYNYLLLFDYNFVISIFY